MKILLQNPFHTLAIQSTAMPSAVARCLLITVSTLVPSKLARLKKKISKFKREMCSVISFSIEHEISFYPYLTKTVIQVNDLVLTGLYSHIS